mmetsp:Transcript_27411/g.54761  ORF Transcript_27411/g.54761 Transcript_27411/m.54761 type:complete len:270 (-) Transcript_27411:105-914(-)
MRTRSAGSHILAFQSIVQHPRHLLQYRRSINNRTPLPHSLELMATMDAPASERNKVPICEALTANGMFLSRSSNPISVLEVAAGAGVHSVYMTENLSKAGFNLESWLPTDPDELSRVSTDQRVSEGSEVVKSKVRPSLPLTLGPNGANEGIWSEGDLRSASFDVIYNVNMIHISPWSATAGLMKMAGERLSVGGSLVIYGPFAVDGEMCESNRKFDESLRSRNTSWRVRNLEDVASKAEANGMKMVSKLEMPANNLLVVFSKVGAEQEE